MIEPINHRDMPGYFLNHRSAGGGDHPGDRRATRLGMQFDLYHCQTTEGDIAKRIEKYMPRDRPHADRRHPGRNEPGTGEIDWPFVFRQIDGLASGAGSAANTGRPARPRPASAGSSGASPRTRGSLAATASLEPSCTTEHRMKIGFIGLGIMGAPMALHLHDAGHQLIVPERRLAATRSAAPPTVRRTATAVAATGRGRDPDGARHARCRERCCSAPDGVAEGLTPGKLVIDMSSISPIATKEFARRINALGCDYLDAPVSGGEVGAKQATLTIMVGGRGRLRPRASRCSSVMGKNITHVGAKRRRADLQGRQPDHRRPEHPGGAEALVFAAKAGADPAKVRQALMGGFAARASWKCTASG